MNHHESAPGAGAGASVRYAILGNSGSGKSTLARALAAPRGLPVLDLDTVAWVPGKVAEPRDPAEAAADVRAHCERHGSFVLEGCYEELVAAALPYRPTLVFLDPGVEVCVAHCRARPFEPHKYASPEAQDAKLDFLLAWVREYYTRPGPMSRAAHRALYETYDGPKVRYAEAVDVARAVAELAPPARVQPPGSV